MSDRKNYVVPVTDLKEFIELLMDNSGDLLDKSKDNSKESYWNDGQAAGMFWAANRLKTLIASKGRPA